MTRPLISDAFAHHAWATMRLIDACRVLTPEQLDAVVAGTYGSIRETLHHLVESDASYLWVLTGGEVAQVDPTAMDLDGLRSVMDADGRAWTALVERDLDPDSVVVRHRPDGSEGHAPLGFRLAQALCHGTDHRSQVCTALTALGLEPPGLDLWDYATELGRLVEVPAPS